MKYIKNPNLPDRAVKRVAADYRIQPESLRALTEMGIETLLTQKCAAVLEAVSGHTDMQLHHVGGNKFICAGETYSYYKERLSGAELIKGSAALREKYPYDTAYNAAVLGGCVICREKSAAREIISEHKKAGRLVINVNQGYAKCNIAPINENAFITSDAGIYKRASAHGIDALLIRPGYIFLEGMSCGFIGGASGMTAPDTLAVNGDIRRHPDCDNIKSFCCGYGVKIISLNKGELYDIGSIIPIE